MFDPDLCLVKRPGKRYYRCILRGMSLCFNRVFRAWVGVTARWNVNGQPNWATFMEGDELSVLQGRTQIFCDCEERMFEGGGKPLFLAFHWQ